MAKPIMVVCFLTLVLSMSTANVNANCMSLIAGLFPCTNYLSNFLPTTPSLQCCDSATNVVSTADPDSLCNCFRQNPLSSGFIQSKAQKLPNLCNLNGFLLLVNCIFTPSSIIPSVLPFTPLIPLPLPPLLPITPVIPLSPLIPDPPVLPVPPVLQIPVLPVPPVFPAPPKE